jgi:uncharacterized protein YdhG (YjbR/CyaY superfamily)
MNSEIQKYLENVSKEREEVFLKLRQTIIENLPEGFEEQIYCGMPSYVVPHSLYPKGYHCDPKQALPFISIANQKGHIALYHMGIYADVNLLNWFTAEYQKLGLKLDMGKSCLRFKNINQIPFDLIKRLISQISVSQWIDLYESNVKKTAL